MKTVIFQMGTVFFSAGMIVFILLLLQKRSKEETAGCGIWIVRCKCIEPKTSGFIRYLFLRHRWVDEVVLEGGAFYLGNGIMDDIFLDTGAGRVRLYLNVMQEKAYLTVLKGSVRVGGYVYGKNTSRQLIIRDYTEVFVQEAKLTFLRKEMGERC